MTNVRELTSRLADLLRRERHAMADFLVALADFDRRRLWVELGHSSLFYFLHRELGLSKGAAFYRKVAAELLQRHPEVIEPLRDGRLCLTSIVELSKVLTTENRDDVLPRYFNVSKQEAKAVSAALLPDDAVPCRDLVTTVRAAAPAPRPDVLSIAQPGPLGTRPAVHPDEPRRFTSREAEPTAAAPPSTRAAPVSAEPLTADLSRLHMTVSRRFLAKLEAARAALSHARPRASAEEILEAGLDFVLAQQAKRKGIVEKPRKVSPPAKADHVTARVKRVVWTRDGGRCQWPLESGGVCGSTLRVEFDHVVPRAHAGASTVENVRLLCRAHNDLAARRALGDEWMDRFTRRKDRPADQSGSATP